MARYISIPTTNASIPSVTFDTDLINTVVYITTTTFGIHAHGRLYTFTTSADGAASTIVNINKAMLSPVGPIVNSAVLPPGVTIANPPVVTAS
jgi:hypothetical protein